MVSCPHGVMILAAVISLVICTARYCRLGQRPVVLPDYLYLQPTNNSTPALGNKATKQEVAKVVTS